LRGFTLLELMVVVTIVALSAALATPSVIRIVQDRRVQQDAAAILGLAQEARARALGRGAAVQLHWDETAAGGKGLLRMTEAQGDDIDGDGEGDVPSTTCTAPLWSSTLKFFQIDEGQKRTWITAVTQAQVAGGVPQPELFLCFTPRGRLFFKDTAPNNWAPAVGVFSFQIQPDVNGAPAPTLAGVPNRYVHVAPNGLARMAL
jgi:prepilin-type N-terminal cleavage/methylation domain-containing protein